MSEVDGQGLLISTKSSEAAELYRNAIDQWHAALPDASILLDEALSLDPDFALGHAARWLIASAQSDSEAARRACKRAESLVGKTTEREQAHIACIGQFIAASDSAVATALAHLRSQPRDLLILTELLARLFFHGGPGKRRKTAKLLEQLAPHYGDDWGFTARFGFHLSENGEPDRGRDLVEGALGIRPDAPYIAHALAHVYYEQGKLQESAAFLGGWLESHPERGGLYGHMQWHLALADWEAARPASALRRYQAETSPLTNTGPKALCLADAGGMLFRMYLGGVPASALPDAGLHELVEDLTPGLGMPFIAVHACAALAAIGDLGNLTKVVKTTRDKASKNPFGQVTVAVANAIELYAHDDYSDAASVLDGLDDAHREAIGGSNVERELVEQLHLQALVKSGKWKAALERACLIEHPQPRWSYAKAIAARAGTQPLIEKQALAVCAQAWMEAEEAAPEPVAVRKRLNDLDNVQATNRPRTT